MHVLVREMLLLHTLIPSYPEWDLIRFDIWGGIQVTDWKAKCRYLDVKVYL